MLKFFLLKSDTESTHSTPRSQARGMLSLPASRQGLILSAAFNPGLKIKVWRRRTHQKLHNRRGQIIDQQ
jgi:hypothetical protein